MLQIPLRNPVQNLYDGYPSGGSFIYPWLKLVSPDKYQYPRIYVEEQDSEYRLSYDT